MPRSIPVPLRQAIRRRTQQGASVTDIAAALGLAPRTVRHLLQHWRDDGPLTPAYERCGRPPQLPSPVIEEALRLRQLHPRWGAGLIRVILQEKYPQDPVPCERTLQRWLQRLRGPVAPPGRRPGQETQRARQPHEVWQMDAAEQMRLRSGQQASWLRVIDECSGAVLKTVVFPPGQLEPGARPGKPAYSAALVRPVG
jgi:transposase